MRKSSLRNRNCPPASSSRAELLATFRQQMSDYARGDRLRSLREGRHLSQEDAAHEIGVSVRAYRDWEKGGGIHWENAKAAAAFYGVEPEEIASREGGDLMAALGHAEDELDPVKRLEDRVAEQEDHLEARIESQEARLLAEISLVRDALTQQQQLLERLLRVQEEDQP